MTKLSKPKKVSGLKVTDWHSSQGKVKSIPPTVTERPKVPIVP